MTQAAIALPTESSPGPAWPIDGACNRRPNAPARSHRQCETPPRVDDGASSGNGGAGDHTGFSMVGIAG
jgi:hypothetical protein